MYKFVFFCSVIFVLALVVRGIQPAQAQIDLPEGTVCTREPIDISIVIDVSGSMTRNAFGAPVTKLVDARDAAKQLVSDLFTPDDDAIHVGLVSFSTCGAQPQSSIRLPMVGRAQKSTLDAKIDSLLNDSGGRTCMHEGVQLTNTLLSSAASGARPGVKKLTVFLTDGMPNVDGMTDDQSRQATLKEIQNGVNANVSYVTIGLGQRGVEIDETLMQCMAGVGNTPNYVGNSCLLNRKVKGDYWYAPTSDDLPAIYRAIAGNILSTCVTPTPIPTLKPTPTPLAAITVKAQYDPSLKGLAPARTVGLLNPTCTSDDPGDPYPRGYVEAFVTPDAPYSGAMTGAGTYTISKLPVAQDMYSVKFSPNDPNIVCTCPTGCQYFRKSAPTSDLRFYVSPIGNSWYQTVGGDVAAQATSTVAVANPIPSTCVSPFCSPFLSKPLGINPSSVGALITTLTGSVNLATGQVAAPPNDHSVKLSTPLACVENYNYFYRLYSMGIDRTSDFVDPSNARKPSAGAVPGGGRNAFYYEGASPLTIREPWELTGKESIVVFVKGDLHIKEQITVTPGAFLAFIVSGNIVISPEVGTTDHASSSDGQVQGVYIANASIQVQGADSPNEKKLVAEGTFAACSGIKIDRDFIRSGISLDNNKYPGALFIYRPDFVTNTPSRMKTSSYVWTEVTP